MTNTVQQLLHKISYIEADMEIQKQILFSLSDSEKEEIEKIIKKIADSKQQIQELRGEIKNLSPEEHQRIVAIENAVEEFKKISSETKFTQINNVSQGDDCTVTTVDGKKTHCLIKALDEEGNITAITVEGQIQYYTIEELQS